MVIRHGQVFSAIALEATRLAWSLWQSPRLLLVSSYCPCGALHRSGFGQLRGVGETARLAGDAVRLYAANDDLSHVGLFLAVATIASAQTKPPVRGVPEGDPQSPVPANPSGV